MNLGRLLVSGLGMTLTDRQLESTESRSARRLHPEDIVVGDSVLVSEYAYQYPSYLWPAADSTTLPPTQPVQITYTAAGEHKPMKVLSICLPFVLCKLVDDKHVVLDVRQNQFMRLAPEFARLAEEAFKSDEDDSNKKNRSKRKSGSKRKKQKQKNKRK